MQFSNGRSIRFQVVLLILTSSLFFCLSESRTGWTQTPNLASTSQSQIVIASPKGALRADICNDFVVHITAAAAPVALQDTSPTPWITGDCKASPSELTRKDGFTIVKTSKIELRINESNGTIEFFDAAGNSLLQEQPGRSLEPLPNSHDSIYRVQDNFALVEDEAIYGLGQHQSGVLNNRGLSVFLSQRNTDVAIPIFLSTRGYGVLWNTASSTLWDNRLAHRVTITTDAAPKIDYYFIYGPEPDQIIHGYRALTGKAPMFGKWAYGLFQSKDHYESQSELLGVAEKYRELHIPLDTIVQDAPWWVKQGNTQFIQSYPDIAGAIDRLHRDHLHVMLSLWPNFDVGTPIAEQMKSRNLLLPGTMVYDATNPEARDLYWKSLAGPLFEKGVDAFWLDASEPEQPNEVQGIQPGGHIFLGDSRLYTNIYPYSHTAGLYEHWRAASSEKRAFILTRSAFLGGQKNAAATWSGDVYSTFWSLARQVPAGLNFVASGIPYWTTDTGGYGYPDYKSTQDPEFRELFVRWLEYSTFCPLFRNHGHRADNRNEFYDFGPVEPILVSYDKLRYRMLPYIYSLAWKVTDQDYTIMRPLIMDWRNDPDVREVGDEFMFGSALLVAPVTQAHGNQREVYLPVASAWYDFWTGAQVKTGLISSEAPLDRIPVYVRAGAILPLGPELEYAAQHPEGPIELRVYRGADGHFDLYDDEGDGYGYEQKAQSIIPIQWNDTERRLTIGPRTGSYPGMPQSIRFHVVFVGPNHGAGAEVSSMTDKDVTYSGLSIQIEGSSKERR